MATLVMSSGLNATRVFSSLLLGAVLMGAAQASQPPEDQVIFASEPASKDARYAVQWVLGSNDHQGMPFVIVDKKSARIFMFDARGRILGASPTLLGLAPGDHSVPGIGARPLSQILPDERTTPAGRFLSEPGRNLTGEDVVWFDYDAALAIHRVRPGSAQERRQHRLDTPEAADNRVSLGCVVVPVAFYESVIAPVLGRQRGVVYVLPETRPVAELFGSQQARLASERP